MLSEAQAKCGHNWQFSSQHRSEYEPSMVYYSYTCAFCGATKHRAVGAPEPKLVENRQAIAAFNNTYSVTEEL